MASFRPTERPLATPLADEIAERIVVRLADTGSFTFNTENTSNITTWKITTEPEPATDTDFDLALLDVELALDDD